jgi:hypothetical protein
MAKLNWSEEPTQPHENNGGGEVKCDKSTGNETQKMPVPGKSTCPFKTGKSWHYGGKRMKG